MDPVTLHELLSDDYRDDPVAHETRWGEGWALGDWEQHFIGLGYGNA